MFHRVLHCITTETQLYCNSMWRLTDCFSHGWRPSLWGWLHLLVTMMMICCSLFCWHWQWKRSHLRSSDFDVCAPIFSPLPLYICLQSSILMSSSQSNKTEEEHVKGWSQGPLMGWMESKQTHWFTRWPGGGCPGRMTTWCWLRPTLGPKYLVVERVQSGPYLLFGVDEV